MARMKFDNVKFVTVWQQSADLSEVAAKFGITNQRASNQAALLRSHGVGLKTFRSGPNDFVALQKLAARLAK